VPLFIIIFIMLASKGNVNFATMGMILNSDEVVLPNVDKCRRRRRGLWTISGTLYYYYEVRIMAGLAQIGWVTAPDTTATTTTAAATAATGSTNSDNGEGVGTTSAGRMIKLRLFLHNEEQALTDKKVVRWSIGW
jgi:hypothetical protein